MHRFRSSTLLPALVLTLALTPALRAAEARIARLIGYGEVTVKLADGTTRRGAEGDAVPEGATLVAGKDAEVHLGFAAELMIALMANAELKITRISAVAEGEGGGTVLVDLVRGSVVGLVAPARNDTAKGLLGIRAQGQTATTKGGVFFIATDGSDGLILTADPMSLRRSGGGGESALARGALAKFGPGSGGPKPAAEEARVPANQAPLLAAIQALLRTEIQIASRGANGNWVGMVVAPNFELREVLQTLVPVARNAGLADPASTLAGSIARDAIRAEPKQAVLFSRGLMWEFGQMLELSGALKSDPGLSSRLASAVVAGAVEGAILGLRETGARAAGAAGQSPEAAAEAGRQAIQQQAAELLGQITGAVLARASESDKALVRTAAANSAEKALLAAGMRESGPLLIAISDSLARANTASSASGANATSASGVTSAGGGVAASVATTTAPSSSDGFPTSTVPSILPEISQRIVTPIDPTANVSPSGR